MENQELEIQTSNLSALAAATPEEMINRASEYATALATVIKERKLSTVISGKQHVNIEGWSTLGTLLGVMPFIEWSRKCEGDNDTDLAYEARCILKTMAGQVVGSGESMATQSEGQSWGKKSYSIRSMAETRATGKAFRLSFAWIMKMAGYDGLPLEEAMPQATPAQTADQKENARILAHIASAQTVASLEIVERLVNKYGLEFAYKTKLDELNSQL